MSTPSASAIHPSEVWETVNGMANGFLAMLPLLVAGLIVFLIFWALASGVRRADSAARANTPVVAWDPKRRLVKVSPIARWTDEDVEAYIEENSLMVNPLLEDGYPSIGCEPCTVRAPGPDARAGRWAGLGKSECGIHL